MDGKPWDNERRASLEELAEIDRQEAEEFRRRDELVGSGGNVSPFPVAEWPAPLDLSALAGQEPEPPRFIIRDWLPAGYATLLAGHGGVGKSGIALSLAACIALGRPWFGLEVRRRRVLYLSCEDRESVLHWRLSRIADHLGVDLADLAGGLEVVDLVGHDTLLWTMETAKGNSQTEAMRTLRTLAKGADVIVVDGISDVFAGNENNRGEVKSFVNALLSVVAPDDGALLLVGHVAKPAATNAKTSEGYSGSTQWHNAVRARWYLYPERTEDDSGAATTGDLLLELQKTNHGKADQQVRFSWSDDAHLFIGRYVTPRTPTDLMARDRRERQGIEDTIKEVTARGDYVPAASTGTRTAYHVLSEQSGWPETLRGGRAERRRFWRHVEALRAMGVITESMMTRADRHKVATLEVGTK